MLVVSLASQLTKELRATSFTLGVSVQVLQAKNTGFILGFVVGFIDSLGIVIVLFHLSSIAREPALYFSPIMMSIKSQLRP